MATMDRAKIEQIIQKTYAARKAGDLDTLVGMFTPDGVFRVAGDPDLFPRAVSARGEPELRKEIRALLDEFEFFEVRPLDLLIDGDKAARRWRAKVRHTPTGEACEIEGSDIWAFRDGKVASVVQFLDTAAIADLVKGAGARGGLREAASRTAPPAGQRH